MKKIFSLSIVSAALFIGNAFTVNAQYAEYYNTYQNAPVSNSYTYTQGCYVYQYDRYTQITSLIGSNCQVQQPVYTYTYPVYQPTNYYPTTNTNYYNYQPPYQTYGYYRGNWYRGYSSNRIGNLIDGITNSFTQNNSQSNYCYYQDGYLVCY